MTTIEITRTDIKHLRAEAGIAGDEKMVRICDKALECEDPTDGGAAARAWNECAAVIAEARG